MSDCACREQKRKRDECEEILEGRTVYICENVMPKLGEINIEPTQKQIREIFLNRIVQGKGLTKAMDLVSGIIMPTPSAMLVAMELLSDGWEEVPGIGELVGVDLGGATTDVYSVADGNPANASTVIKGLPEPYTKRTVEGDIGMRYSVKGILEAVGERRLSKISGINKNRVVELVSWLEQHTDYIPDNEEMENGLCTCLCKSRNSSRTSLRFAGAGLYSLWSDLCTEWKRLKKSKIRGCNRWSVNSCKTYRRSCKICTV